MRKRCYIGLDCSTTSATAVAWSPQGQFLSEGRSEISIDTPQAGFAEQPADAWWTASATALHDCVVSLPTTHRPTAIGIATQRETFTLLDENLCPVRPAILWYDNRATDELQQLTETIGLANYHQTTGKQLDITSPLAKMAWIASHEPALWEKAAHFTDVPAFLAAKLTGRAATAACGVDTCGLVNMGTSSWASDVLRHVPGVNKLCFPELMPTCSVAGAISAEVAAQSGLPEDTPVIIAGGDGHCFAVGTACVSERNHASLTLGTSAVLSIPLTEGSISDTFRTLLSCFPDRFLAESVIQCGSATIRWFDETFAGREGTLSPQEWDKKCSNVPPGSHGLLVLPHWRGVRVPRNDPLARGVTMGWSDQATPASFRRAIMEGIAFEVEELLRAVCEETSQTIKTVVVAGGGGKCDLWCQILADVLERDILRPECVELTSLGAALCARTACVKGFTLDKTVEDVHLESERFRPNTDTQRLYRKLRKAYSHLYGATKQLSHMLAEL